MDRNRLQPLADPEFRSHRPVLRGGGLDAEPENYLRLVANPFLGLIYAVAWLVALYHLFFIERLGPLLPILIVTLLAGLGLVPFLMQYHCLDCGRTGRLTRWRNHLCPRSLERREAGRRRWLRGPTPPVQVALWIWVMMGLALALNGLDLPLWPSGG